jgi:ADP-ribosylation factor 2-binding protein
MSEEIFTVIADLITQDDFAKSQMEYFEKNKDKFEDTEENKLEYTNIYTEYVYILEQIIEANLKEKYSDEQIELFYTTFKDNLSQYEKINPEVVDTLFGFIDFEKFKKSILLHKNALDENYNRAERT